MTAYYLSSLLAFTGGHMINYTVIMYLQDKLGSDLLSGIGFGLSFGSSIVFGWFAGVLCDRVSPLRVDRLGWWAMAGGGHACVGFSGWAGLVIFGARPLSGSGTHGASRKAQTGVYPV